MTDWSEIGEAIDAKDYEYLFTMINPKTHRLFDICTEDDSPNDVRVVLPSEKYGERDEQLVAVGEGNYDSYDTKYLETGSFYRSHSPSGVAEHGSGYGFLLYSGMAVSAFVNGSEEGIFSPPGDRSSTAEAFWEAQVARGFADSVCSDEGESTREIEVPLSYGDAEEAFDREIQYETEDNCAAEFESAPDEVTVEVTYKEQKEINTLSAYSVFHSGMVLTWDESNKRLDDLDENAWNKPPVEILYEIKLDNCFDSKLIVLLVEHIREFAEGGADDKKLIRLLETAPPEMLVSPSDELYAEFKMSEKLRHTYMELTGGQRRFDFEAAKRRQDKLTANPPRHSKAWKDFFGDAVDVDY